MKPLCGIMFSHMSEGRVDIRGVGCTEAVADVRLLISVPMNRLLLFGSWKVMLDDRDDG